MENLALQGASSGFPTDRPATRPTGRVHSSRGYGDMNSLYLVPCLSPDQTCYVPRNAGYVGAATCGPSLLEMRCWFILAYNASNLDLERYPIGILPQPRQADLHIPYGRTCRSSVARRPEPTLDMWNFPSNLRLRQAHNAPR